MAKEITKKELESVAKELNTFFDPPIETGRKATIDGLKEKIISAGGELQEDDELTESTLMILAALDVKVPRKEAGKIEETEEVVEPESHIDMPPNLMEEEDEEEVIEIDKPVEKEKSKQTIKKGVKEGVGVIASILEFISASKKGITILEIHKGLIARFADRDEEAMLKTIKAQISGKKSPCRMEKEKKVTFEIQDGKYSVKQKTEGK